jgi:hypothetical protein
MSEQGATEQSQSTKRTRRTALGGVIEVEPNIVERMAAVMGDMSAVGKTGRNTDQGYAFRSIDEFMNTLHAPLVKHSVVITPRVLDRQIDNRTTRSGGNMRVVDLLVEFTFSSPDGSTLSVVTAGEGADTSDKATNKAMAAALKYAIMQTFMVPTREITDGDAVSPDVPSQQQSDQHEAEERERLQTPPRAEIMSKLDEACEALGKTRAKLTEKWRQTHNIGPATNLDDASKVSDLVLYRFVAALQPYVEQARKQESEQQSQDADDASVAANDPSAVDPADTARAAVANAMCDARDGEKLCTRPAGHDGEHAWW